MKLTVAEFKERRAAIRADEAAHFREHWPWIVLESLGDLGFGVLLGVGLGLAAVLWVLHELGGV